MHIIKIIQNFKDCIMRHASAGYWPIFHLILIQDMIFVADNSDKIKPNHNTMSKVLCEDSFVRICMVRSALRDVLKDSTELASQMDGDSDLKRHIDSRESSIIYESWDWEQTGEQNQRSAGGGCGRVEVFVCQQADVKVTTVLKWGDLVDVNSPEGGGENRRCYNSSVVLS